MFSQLLEACEHDSNVHFAHNAQERDASLVVTVAPVPFVLIQGDKFCIFHVLRDATFMRDLQRLMRSGGMPSAPGALPQAKLSIALLSSSSVGSASKSSMDGIQCRVNNTVLSGVEL